MKFVNFKIEDKKLIGVLANDEDKIIALNDLYADKTFCCMQDVIEQLNEDDIVIHQKFLLQYNLSLVF